MVRPARPFGPDTRVLGISKVRQQIQPEAIETQIEAVRVSVALVASVIQPQRPFERSLTVAQQGQTVPGHHVGGQPERTVSVHRLGDPGPYRLRIRVRNRAVHLRQITTGQVIDRLCQLGVSEDFKSAQALLQVHATQSRASRTAAVPNGRDVAIQRRYPHKCQVHLAVAGKVADCVACI